MTTLRLFGTYTALVTPFREAGAGGSAPNADAPIGAGPIDWEAFERLVEDQIAGGVEGLVPCGTTGESPTLTHAEHAEVIRRTVQLARGRVQVIAGTGSNSTHEAVALSRSAEAAGVDGVMVVVPYYNRPTQDGLVGHFTAVAAATGKPVIVYNVPGRTGSDLTADTLSRICDKAPNVVATKEATGNVLRAQELKRRLGERLAVLCGDDALTVAMVAVGASGVISVTSNLLPAATARVTHLALQGKFDEARTAHFALLAVHEAMFIEANPGPVKAALAMEGKMRDVVRGPLAPLSEKARETLRVVLATYGRGA